MARSNLIETRFAVMTRVFSLSTDFFYAKYFGTSLSIFLSSELTALYFFMYNVNPSTGNGFLT